MPRGIYPRTELNFSLQDSKSKRFTSKGTPLDRFFQKANMENGMGSCWEWVGGKNHGGYGILTIDNHPHQAHRFAYETYYGKIPEGLYIDHLCRNPGCVNPCHLEAVTTRENLLRGRGPAAIHAKQTYCIHGHEFIPENTYLSKGKRSCKTCASQRAKQN